MPVEHLTLKSNPTLNEGPKHPRFYDSARFAVDNLLQVV